jgi:hypothetical protein
MIALNSLTVCFVISFIRNTVSVFLFFIPLALFIQVKSFAMQVAYSNLFKEHNALKMGSSGIDLGLGIVVPPHRWVSCDKSIDGVDQCSRALLFHC